MTDPQGAPESQKPTAAWTTWTPAPPGPPGPQPYGPPAPGAPGPPGAPPATNAMAILALVFAVIVAPVGIVLGIVARRQVARTGENGRGLATAGIVVGSVLTALSAAMVVVAVVTLVSYWPAVDREPSSPVPGAAPAYPVPTAAPVPTATPGSLDTAQVDAVFTRYMNGLSGQDMAQLRAATCPRLRSTLVGFYLHDYLVGSWQELPYAATPGVDYVTVQAQVDQRSAGGASAGAVTYSWNVERESDGTYFVCGWYG